LSATELRPVLIGLPPLIDDRSLVLVLGSFPSEMSLAKSEYYGNPQNHFWPVMEALFAIDRRAPYAQRTARLLARGIAVWDVIARCNREGSGDDRIADARPNPLISLLEEHPSIRHIAFNGGMALKTARELVPAVFSLPGVSCERMPSTSPRNARMPFAAKVEEWRRTLEWLKEATIPPSAVRIRLS
jgi:hypoxanthine-DNA glycosylase